MALTAKLVADRAEKLGIDLLKGSVEKDFRGSVGLRHDSYPSGLPGVHHWMTAHYHIHTPKANGAAAKSSGWKAALVDNAV
ncbi:hypothetical protein GCM10011491_20160 [Brucella endophytica]|uniref:Uncharacterized protein n=1 Tax=Brucella endophytica TaxID=1963359 RepID=A0A916SAW4_9HYPH|nr:hypothetical protein GCM10011491_20160 [Brucella endophytica]